jgi:Tfp pilus assembly protein PilV
MKIKNKNSGFTLLETLAALSVLIFAILGPLTLAYFSIRSASLSENQFTAFYLAQEALEFVKNQRDTNALGNASNWLNGMTNCQSANGCFVDVQYNSIQTCPSQCSKLKYNSTSGFYNYQNGNDTIFTRQVKLTQISSYEEKVTINLSWQERFGAQSFTLEENIFNWP